MKNNLKTLFILLLALLLVSSLIVVAACEKDPVTVTMTVDYGLGGENDTLTVDVGKPFVSKLVTPTSNYTFGGWYLDGEQVTSSTLAPDKDFTVTAKWRVPYRVEYYLEKLTPEGAYELSAQDSLDIVGELGSTVTAEAKSIYGYTFDENNALNVKSATLNGSGVTLKLYYNRAQIAVTFDKLITSASGTMSSITGKYGATVTLPHVGFTSDYTFVGWNTAPDGTGTAIADGASYTISGATTLYAQWQTTYTVTFYVEKDVDNDAATPVVDYDVHSTQTFNGIIGHKVTTTATADVDGNKYDVDDAKSVKTGVVSEDGLQLSVYYGLHQFTILYLDDQLVEYVKYGANYTVRTPENADDSYYVEAYNTMQSGNGREYAFGSKITNVREDYVLYPVIVDVYMDAEGSGDTVEIHRNKTGFGSATLVKDGVRYDGRKVTDAQDYAAFEVTVEDTGETICGRYYVYSAINWFNYRGDEYGTYMYYDYIIAGDDGLDATVLLTLDGYGEGVIMLPALDGTERFVSYHVEYWYNETYDDYDTYFPNGEYKNVSFRIAKRSFDEYEDYAGYFMLWNIDGEDYEYAWYDNQTVYQVYMYLNGYGEAEVYKLDDDGKDVWRVTGTYYGSNYYLDTGELEYIFRSDNEEVFASCYFTIVVTSFNDTAVGFFLTKNAEYGIYTESEDVSFPELYLDGYGGARYTQSADDDGIEGNYKILNPSSDNGTYNIVVRFYEGGAMLVEIVILRNDDNMAIGTFTVQQGGFVVDENGVLTEYIYDVEVGPSSVIVIPEQVNGITVKEIAANVFNGLNITSVTFPATLERIGDYAFSNGNFNDASALRTAIFLGSNPPVLGKDVFRWIKGSNLRIIVPDDAAEAYRTAASWTKDEDSQKGGYAKFVVTQWEIDNKPVYEVKDGVLVSYNNKDENPENVVIDDLPDEVTEIAAGVFFNLDYIVSVNLNNVKVIGNNAFYGCVNLATVTFNSAMESIGEGAFYSCVSLTSVNLGEVKFIGQEAFSRCLALKEVIIGSSLKSIGHYAFFECARTEGLIYDVDGEPEQKIELFDLIVTISATTAPEMGYYVFQGTQAQVFVANYDTVLSYAKSDTWTTYGKYLRVKANSVETWYSKSNNNGWKMTLGDYLVFDDSYVGWYKWDGNTLYVTWYQYTALANTVKITSQTATLVNGELVGLSLKWDDGVDYVFVKEGTTLIYESDADETFAITFGADYALFNGNSVKLEMYGYQLQFSFEGYLYTVTLESTDDVRTFSYTKSKITVVTEYTAEDGSTITIYYGNYISANGRLKDVNGVEIYTETRGWYLTKLEGNVYAFKWNHATGNYYVVITLLTDSTFSYEWSIDSEVTVYRDTSTGDVAVVTRSTTTNDVSITILFYTSNGSQSQLAQITSQNGNVFTIVINGKVTVERDDGTTYEEDSAFNGTYTLTLIDGDNPTFTLEKIY